MDEEGKRLMEQLTRVSKYVIFQVPTAAEILSQPEWNVWAEDSPSWHLEEDVLSPTGTLELYLSSFVKDTDGVNQQELRMLAKRSVSMLGQRHALALLRVNHRIPKSWRNFRIQFPATVWVLSTVRMRLSMIPEIYYLQDRWNLGWRGDYNDRFYNDLRGQSRLAQIRSCS